MRAGDQQPWGQEKSAAGALAHHPQAAAAQVGQQWIGWGLVHCLALTSSAIGGARGGLLPLHGDFQIRLARAPRDQRHQLAVFQAEFHSQLD